LFIFIIVVIVTALKTSVHLKITRKCLSYNTL